MKIKISIISLTLASILLAFFSKKLFYFRWIGYEFIPQTTNILDEKNYVAAGYSFLKTGIPTAWSILNGYLKLAKEKGVKGVVDFNNVSLTLDGLEPSLKNKHLFNYPLYYVTNTDVGKGMDGSTFS